MPRNRAPDDRRAPEGPQRREGAAKACAGDRSACAKVHDEKEVWGGLVGRKRLCDSPRPTVNIARSLVQFEPAFTFWRDILAATAQPARTGPPMRRSDLADRARRRRRIGGQVMTPQCHDTARPRLHPLFILSASCAHRCAPFIIPKVVDKAREPSPRPLGIEHCRHNSNVSCKSQRRRSLAKAAYKTTVRRAVPKWTLSAKACPDPARRHADRPCRHCRRAPPPSPPCADQG